MIAPGHHSASLVLLLAGIVCYSGSSAGSTPNHRLYVSALAQGGGDGTHARPFDTLQALEQASAPGDTLVVLAAPTRVAPLDGGIALKPGQRLLGEAPRNGYASRITNRSRVSHDGDAVVLAPGAEVANLVIERPHRGGIYGLNTPGVQVHHNDISGHNQSCTLGLMIAPITIPSSIPGIVVPQPLPLPNGWAGIMVDADRGTGRIHIHDNEVRDSACGDGIDLRMSGTANYTARLSGNIVHGLEQGPPERGHLSVLAMGMQTRDRSRLRATLDGNTQYDIGDSSQATDSEGVFANLVDESELTAEVVRNSFHQGLGGFSANGLELVISSGSARAVMTVRGGHPVGLGSRALRHRAGLAAPRGPR